MFGILQFKHSKVVVMMSSLAAASSHSDNNINVQMSVPLSNLNCIRHTFLVPDKLESDIYDDVLHNKENISFRITYDVSWRIQTVITSYLHTQYYISNTFSQTYIKFRKYYT